MSQSFGLEFVSGLVGVNHVEFYWNKILTDKNLLWMCLFVHILTKSVVRFSLQ